MQTYQNDISNVSWFLSVVLQGKDLSQAPPPSASRVYSALDNCIKVSVIKCQKLLFLVEPKRFSSASSVLLFA